MCFSERNEVLQRKELAEFKRVNPNSLVFLKSKAVSRKRQECFCVLKQKMKENCWRRQRLQVRGENMALDKKTYMSLANDSRKDVATAKKHPVRQLDHGRNVHLSSSEPRIQAGPPTPMRHRCRTKLINNDSRCRSRSRGRNEKEYSHSSKSLISPPARVGGSENIMREWKIDDRKNSHFFRVKQRMQRLTYTRGQRQEFFDSRPGTKL